MTNSTNPFADPTVRAAFLTPIVPLTPNEWAALSGKAKWDIMCALRGPDLEHEALKWHTTAVIRGKMRECIRVGGVVNYVQGAILLPRLDARYAHFHSHIREAAVWLRVPCIHVDIPLHDLPACDGPGSTIDQITRWYARNTQETPA